MLDPKHPAPPPSEEPAHGHALADPPRAGLAYDRRAATTSGRVPARPGAPLDAPAFAATLLESAYEGICTTDATGTITYANPRLASMLGWPLAELPGRSLFDFMDADTAFAARTRFARRQRGIAETVELPLRRRDGATLWTHESVSSLWAADGTLAGARTACARRTRCPRP